MRILVIADPTISIPPVHYGGAERVIALLCDGLAKSGHTVDLMAKTGSKNYGGRLILHKRPNIRIWSRAYRKIRFQIHSLAAARGADLVINYGRPDYLWYLFRKTIPVLIQFQNPVLQAEIDACLVRRRRNIRFAGISQAQLKDLLPVERLDVVPNATDVSVFPFTPKPSSDRYFAFLGRLTANKGVHLAITAARQAGVRLKIAGTKSDEPGGLEYFERDVLRQIGGDIEYIGPVNDVQKAEFLGGAAGFLFPIQWAEPFGIVMAEALACGCPVIAWRNGSVPEVVKPGETGFIVESVDQMVEAIRQVDTIDRAACRADAEARFSQQAMVSGYLRVIDRLLAEVKSGTA